MSTPTTTSDLVVVGAGIVGLALAADAVSRGLSVTVVERDERAVGASIRNFGHVCATAQSGRSLDYALAARERWLALAGKAGFTADPCGTLVVARADDEAAVLEEFADERGPEHALLRTPAQVAAVLPHAGNVVAGAELPLDLRVDPREALPAITSWLADEGVDFRWSTTVGGIDPGLVRTSRGDLAAGAVVLAAGHDVDRLFPAIAEDYDLQRCRLQMLEVAGTTTIRPAVLSGLSLLRYAGFAATPSAARVRARFTEEAPELLDVAMNLMLTQRPDGAIVLGDTHHYARTHLPFDEERLSDLLLREGAGLLGDGLRVLRRWRGVYASSTRTDFLVATPHPGTRVVSVTSGIGMTTALGLAPAVLDDLL